MMVVCVEAAGEGRGLCCAFGRSPAAVMSALTRDSRVCV